MKQLLYKYKILVNGLKVTGEYKTDGFLLKEAQFNKNIFKSNCKREQDKMCLNMNKYLYSCIIDNELKYKYFESEDYKRIEIPDKTAINKEKLYIVLKKYPKILTDIKNLEQKLRLTFNIPLLFQIINIGFYDEGENLIGSIQYNRPISFWNRCTYNIDDIEFSNNSRFKINFDVMKNTNNNYFNRALEFYDNSFDSEKTSNRFILAFTSLEAIFNLNSENVTEKISKYTAKLLAEDNLEMYKEIYIDIKKLYKKRCDYIHGSKINNIDELDEKLLRRYVRKVIIAYWIIIMNTRKTAKQILEYLDSDEKLDLQIQMTITALNSNSFSEQQNKLINVVEKELNMRMTKQMKRNFLKNCNC